MDNSLFDWQAVLNERHAWLDGTGPENDVVVASRIRLARNLADTPFPTRMEKAVEQKNLERIASAALDTPALKGRQRIDLTGLKKIERQLLMERHFISPEMAVNEGERGVIIDYRQPTALMINEEDHIRLQTFEAGLALERAWRRADTIDNQLGERLPFSYDSEWGFCTRCPTNIGTGLRASCLLHLPALMMNGDLEPVLDGIRPMGVNARGFYGEGQHAVGDLFQIANALSLGQTEDELIGLVQKVVASLIRSERRAREALASGKFWRATEDAVYRSWGILRHAGLISYDEAMSLLSRVRLGLQLGVELPTRLDVLNILMVTTQPAHLQLLNGGALKAEERDHQRAALIRRKLNAPNEGSERTTQEPK